MKNKHQIYLVSDSTGETLDRMFLAVKAQFENFIPPVALVVRNGQKETIDAPIDELRTDLIKGLAQIHLE